MENFVQQFRNFSKYEKHRIRSLNEVLNLWEFTIHKEARVANGVLQKRRRDPFDLMVSGSVSVCVSYSLGGDSPENLFRRNFNATAIDGDDPFGGNCGLDANGERLEGFRYRLGPMPCCFLLHDLAIGLLSQNPESNVLLTLARVAEVTVEIKVTAQFLEVLSESKDA